MLSIAICDDLPEHSDRLKLLIDQQLSTEASVLTYSSAGALLNALDKGATFDLCFLDVELGADSGISLGSEINRRLPSAQIVFVTANIINAVDVGEAAHTYFLTKPVAPEKLKRALERSMERILRQTDRRLTVTIKGGGTGVVSTGDVLYCERTKRNTDVVCVGRTLQTAEDLTELEAKLPRLLFARPHNSFLVNLMHVSKLERTEVHLDNGVTLSVSNQRKVEFRAALAAYVTKT